jgi:uncharacterized protein DUF4145
MTNQRNPSFYCPACRMQVQLITRGEHHYETESANKDYIFGHCAKCFRAGLVEYGREGATGDASAARQLWPSPVRLIEFDLPPRVMESYQEALRCESAGAWIATALMARRTLDAVVRDFAPEHERPFEGLKAMLAKGYISEELYRWGDELRFLSEVSAQAADVVGHQDAKEALEFLHALIENLYFLREKFKRMQARRQRGKQSTAPEA